jgi:hypothetical protein
MRGAAICLRHPGRAPVIRRGGCALDQLAGLSLLTFSPDGQTMIANSLVPRVVTLADRERVLGADHPDTVTTRDYLTLASQDAVRDGEG